MKQIFLALTILCSPLIDSFGQTKVTKYSVLQIANTQETQDFKKIQLRCIYLAKANNTYVFNSSEELSSELNRIRPPHPKCSTIQKVDVDFENQTLIGMKIQTGGCRPPIITPNIEFVKNKVILSIAVKPTGNCRKLYESFYWYAIPKTSKNLIEFKRT